MSNRNEEWGMRCEVWGVRCEEWGIGTKTENENECTEFTINADMSYRERERERRFKWFQWFNGFKQTDSEKDFRKKNENYV